MRDTPDTELTPAESRDLRRLAGIMIPASDEYGVPGADDATIFADIVRSLGRDRSEVRKALATLRATSDGHFADLDAARAEIIAAAFLNQDGPMLHALGRAVVQCYYRDDRVIIALG